jgi:hypothetical protein
VWAPVRQTDTYETAVTVFADGRVVPMSPAAVGGASGPLRGSHLEVFRQRESLCEYKAADLGSVADQLERLNADRTNRFGGRLDMGRLGAFGHSFGSCRRPQPPDPARRTATARSRNACR